MNLPSINLQLHKNLSIYKMQNIGSASKIRDFGQLKKNNILTTFRTMNVYRKRHLELNVVMQ